MNRIVLLLVFLISFSWIFESCSIQKRKHLPGWHISSVRLRSKTNKQKHTVSIIDNSSAFNATQPDSTSELHQKMDPPNVFIPDDVRMDSSSKGGTDSFIESMIVDRSTSDNAALNEIERESLKSPTDSKFRQDNSQNEAEDPEKEESSHFFAKLTGGFLGVLLALLALVPLFAFMVALGETELEDDVFDWSRSDPPFVRAFQRSFNAVIKYGIVVLWVLIFLGFLVALFMVGYQIAGVIGGVIALALFIGIILLLAYLLGLVIDFILPDY